MGTARALAAQTDATALNPRNLLASPRFASTPFTLGVASGDPSADGMVLWTRLATEPLVFGGGMPARPMVVEWQLAADEGMRKVVRQVRPSRIPNSATRCTWSWTGWRPDGPTGTASP